MHSQGTARHPFSANGTLSSSDADGAVPGASPVVSAAPLSSESPPAPRMVTPCRPLKHRPSWKLGSLFATMREKQAAEEATTVEAAKELIADLEGCTNVAKL